LVILPAAFSAFHRLEPRPYAALKLLDDLAANG
jgi:hypothetical protein